MADPARAANVAADRSGEMPPNALMRRAREHLSNMTTILDIIAILLGLTAFFGWLNHRFIGLPMTIGMVLFGLVAALLILAADALIPGITFGDELVKFLKGLDFYDTLMKGMLGFLLFAGALHVDLSAMVRRRYAIALMATFGVLLSTALVGAGAWLVFQALGLAVPFMVCLVLGALISPTDPVAVMGVLKVVKVPPSLEAKIAGESLFNDGVGVVVFAIVVAIAFHTGAKPLDAVDVAVFFVKEAAGGAILGIVTGGLVHFAMRGIDDYVTEIMLTLALVTVTYAVALHLHISPLIAVVCAGLLIGNIGTEKAMSENTREHLHNFWTLIDEVLNAVLFLLIGLEIVLLRFDLAPFAAGLIAIPLVLAARFISVGASVVILKPFRRFTEGAIWVLTWGGLRGGISIALALSLPESPEKATLLTVTFVVVVFSVVVQGLTISRVIRRALPASAPAETDQPPVSQTDKA